MEGLYFDGKNSKPYKVAVKDNGESLYIESNEPNEYINRFWIKRDITSESFSTGDRYLLSYGTFPFERIELKGRKAEMFMLTVLHHESKIKTAQHYITRANPIKLVITSFCILAVVIYGYLFHISPFIGEQSVKLIPKSSETFIGQNIYKRLQLFENVDSKKSELLMDFYDALNFQSEYDIKIDYSTSKSVNAFAIPGGQIVIYEGLIQQTKCWDELAALIGHELAHVNERHSFKQLARSISSYLIFSVLTGDVAGASTVLLENAQNINEMANSRKHEKEADLVGLEYLKNSQIRPSAMVDLFTSLSKDLGMVKKLEKPMEFLSTHPSTGNRIEYIESIIEKDRDFNYEPKDNNKAQEIWYQLKSEIDTSYSSDIIKLLRDGFDLEKDESQ